MLTLTAQLLTLASLIPLAFGTVNLVFRVLEPPRSVHAVRGVPGLSEREARDLLWLDWLLAEGLVDRGLLNRYLFLATRVDYELTDRALTIRDVPDLEVVTCPWCDETWSVTQDCPMCRDAYGAATPLARRPSVLGAI
ncbi:MAG TPA: hypothetical protein VFK52_12780 [Nocardioidaceae bacterium]|nr:hypothetical protein [Nocardioidaceae bacterium]